MMRNALPRWGWTAGAFAALPSSGAAACRTTELRDALLEYFDQVATLRMRNGGVRRT